MLVHRHRHGHHLAVLRHRHRPFRGHRHVLHRSLTIAVRRRLVLLPILAHDGHRGAVHVGPVLRHRHGHRRRLHQLDLARREAAIALHLQGYRAIRVPRRRCRHPRVGLLLHQVELRHAVAVGRRLLPADRHRRVRDARRGPFLHHRHCHRRDVRVRQVHRRRGHRPMLVHLHRHGHHLPVLRHRHRPLRGHRHVLHRSLTIAVRRRLVLLPIIVHDGHRGAVHAVPAVRHRHGHRGRLPQLDLVRTHRGPRVVHLQLHRVIQVPRRHGLHPGVGRVLHQPQRNLSVRAGLHLLRPHRHRRVRDARRGPFLHHLHLHFRNVPIRQVHRRRGHLPTLVHRHRHGHHLPVLLHRHRSFRGLRHILHRGLAIRARRRPMLLPIIAHDGHRGSIHAVPILRHRHIHQRFLRQLDHARIRMARGIHRQLHRAIRVPHRRCLHPLVGHPLHQVECGYTATIGRALLLAHRYRRAVNGLLGGCILLHHLYPYWVQRQVARAHLAVRAHLHRNLHLVAVRLHGHRPLRRHRHARQRHAPIPIRIDVLVRIPDAIHKGNRRPPIHPRRHHRLLRQLDHARIRLAIVVHLQGYRVIQVPRRRCRHPIVGPILHQPQRNLSVRAGLHLLRPHRHRRADDGLLRGRPFLHHRHCHRRDVRVRQVYRRRGHPSMLVHLHRHGHHLPVLRHRHRPFRGCRHKRHRGPAVAARRRRVGLPILIYNGHRGAGHAAPVVGHRQGLVEMRTLKRNLHLDISIRHKERVILRIRRMGVTHSLPKIHRRPALNGISRIRLYRHGYLLTILGYFRIRYHCPIWVLVYRHRII